MNFKTIEETEYEKLLEQSELIFQQSYNNPKYFSQLFLTPNVENPIKLTIVFWECNKIKIFQKINPTEQTIVNAKNFIKNLREGLAIHIQELFDNLLESIVKSLSMILEKKDSTHIENQISKTQELLRRLGDILS